MAPSENLELGLLRTFVTVVDAGSFSVAATRLLRGQPAISLQVKRLEDQLGKTLLQRSPRQISLTPDGETLLQYARRMLSLNDEAIDQMKEPEVSGVVRLGAPEDFATSHLPKVLGAFARSHPRVTIEMTCELTLQVLSRFRKGGLDLALVKRERSSSVKGTSVWREPLVWVAADSSVALSGPVPLVVSPSPCLYRKRATDTLSRAGRKWRIAYTCASLAGAHAAVRAGLGVAVLPKEMVPQDLLILDAERSSLPQLADTEMALLHPSKLTAAAAKLKEHIIRELERPRAPDGRR
ncbi:MAG: LysR family transcriptional regulator [Proteobacteria bacterium]|nr:LysR family transcriptional regulator [Pseudomonadota bacterium]